MLLKKSPWAIKGASLYNALATSVDFDRDKVEACLKQVGLSERFGAKENGLDTPLYKDFEEEYSFL